MISIIRSELELLIVKRNSALLKSRDIVAGCSIPKLLYGTYIRNSLYYVFIIILLIKELLTRFIMLKIDCNKGLLIKMYSITDFEMVTLSYQKKIRIMIAYINFHYKESLEIKKQQKLSLLKGL